MLYPLKFHPIYKKRIWGGQELKQHYGKSKAPEMCGESWEISCLPDNISVVANGYLSGNNIQELTEVYMGELVGDAVYEKFGCDFPLLIKLIDANSDLSFQVHPNNDYAFEHHRAYGKSELWYILAARPHASLVSGFNRQVSPEIFSDTLLSGNIESIVNRVMVKPGDVFYMPAGRIHTIGKGIVLAEIQQSSDITYRVWDYDRTDENGNTRELHLQQAAEVLDYTAITHPKTTYTKQPDASSPIIHTPHFACNIVCLLNTLQRDYAHIESFVVLICSVGVCQIECQGESYRLAKGETMLIPAVITEINMVPDGYAEMLEVYLDTQTDMQ